MVKKVAAINDLSGLGRCSLTAAIPILSALGVQACPMPTAILSNQTGYPHFFIRDFTEDMQEISNEWEQLGFSFDGIYSGFLSDENQVEVIENFITRFKKRDTLFLVDPVMGDDGAVYPNFSDGLIRRIKELAFKGDIITPNLTEACILAGTNYDTLVRFQNTPAYLDEICQLGEKLIQGNVKKAVVTGIRHQAAGDRKQMFYNLVIDCKDSRLATMTFIKKPVIGGSYSGTGDILASIICGMLIKGRDFQTAVEAATDFVALCVRDSFKEGTDRNDGVNFEKFMKVLTAI